MSRFQRRVLVDSVAAETHLRRAFNVRVPANTIRQWAARQKINRYRDRKGRVAYDLREIEAEAERRGWIARA